MIIMYIKLFYINTSCCKSLKLQTKVLVQQYLKYRHHQVVVM